MTQQHLLGELSLILGELQAVSTSEAAAREIALLRREVETGAFGALPSVMARALELTQGWWRDAWLRGDPAASGREAAICAELWEFAVCAGLVQER
jgi:hypothetical protein